ncbi:phage_rel_nuc, putative phage-type endonuclease [uncultured Caudovirales phage]|uniref:Phage_rel_nuc, putative phage-type endonuclease n=1 Tax=uncultured Caudovirales phage TaxID=2100421 RepID=A0A6J5N6Q9_9CAUD|nr:phage_rel_nuc, putative phage-type endonuclease [uncultured Caudovirales phage]
MNTHEQRTEEWFRARLGVPTASNAKHIIAKLKNGKAAQAREDYLMRLLFERVTGQNYPGFTNTAMQHGIDNEAAAREEYEWVTGSVVEETGFLKHEEVDFGASPDGLVGVEGVDGLGLIEIKCPYSPDVHLHTILEDKVPVEHLPQIQTQLWVTGRQWCDFVSYDPRHKGNTNIFIKRVQRNEEFIKNFKLELADFIIELKLKHILITQKATP